VPDLTPDEQTELEARRLQAKDEADQKRLTELRQRAIKWAAAKSERFGREAVTHDQRGMPENSRDRLAKSWAYDQFAKALESGQFLSDPILDRDPEVAQFRPLHAAAIREKRVQALDQGPLTIG